MKITNLFQTPRITESVPMRSLGCEGFEKNVERSVISEHRLTVILGGYPAMEIACTATDLVNLVAGRLLSEGFIRGTGDIESIRICENGALARVMLSIPLPSPAMKRQVSSCCTDNISYFEGPPLERLPQRTATADPKTVFALAAAASKDRELHRHTSGTHSSILMHGGKAVYECEDMGRHNALDKAIGEMLLKGYPAGECMIYTTGRVPVDMVRKAIRAGIGALVSKSVPTLQALEMAEKYNLTLFTRTWPDAADTASGC